MQCRPWTGLKSIPGAGRGPFGGGRRGVARAAGAAGYVDDAKEGLGHDQPRFTTLATCSAGPGWSLAISSSHRRNMDENRTKEQIDSHADAVQRGDFDAVIADFTRSCRRRRRRSPSRFRSRSRPPRPQRRLRRRRGRRADPLRRQVSEITVRSHWREVDGRPLIVARGTRRVVRGAAFRPAAGGARPRAERARSGRRASTACARSRGARPAAR